MDGENKRLSMEQPNIKNIGLGSKTCSLLNRGVPSSATVVTPKDFQGNERV